MKFLRALFAPLQRAGAKLQAAIFDHAPVRSGGSALQIELALPVVRPLIKIIRELAAELPAAGGADPGAESVRQDMPVLLALFSPHFERTGTIKIDEQNAPAVLRACAWLRLALRRGALSANSDELVETGELDEKQPEVLCYLFLATLQEQIVKTLPQLARPLIDLATLGTLPARTETATVAREKAAPAGTAEEKWQVVVRNDPVNLMTYVTHVFGVVLCLSKEKTERHMLEVHEQKSSVVWQGARGEAEAYARKLQAWHLSVELREGKFNHGSHG